MANNINRYSTSVIREIAGTKHKITFHKYQLHNILKILKFGK